MPDLDAVLTVLQARLGPLQGRPEPLLDGITNRNFRVCLGGADYVVRLDGKETDVLGIDREAELAAQQAAASLGIAPSVVLRLPEEGCQVTTFLPGGQATSAQLRATEGLAPVAAALRALHAGPALPTAFDAFAVVEDYRARTLARGGSVPPAYAEFAPVASRIQAALSGPEHEPVPCHNDLLAANFVRGDGRIQILDWEYAGMGDRYFDLGNLSVNNSFSPDDDARLLEAYWGERPTARRLAALGLMRFMSDFREAMWGVVPTVVGTAEAYFRAYAHTHFDRLREAAADPLLERRLEEAAG
jgi:thiamine kinase-like enzyme